MFDIRCAAAFVDAFLAIPPRLLHVRSSRRNQLCRIDAVKESSCLLKRSALRLDDVDVQEDELEDKPASIHELHRDIIGLEHWIY